LPAGVVGVRRSIGKKGRGHRNFVEPPPIPSDHAMYMPPFTCSVAPVM